MTDTKITEWHEVSVPIAADNLPKGPWWEEDGACWRAGLCGPGEGCEWRWKPLNEKALGKNGPEGPMTDFAPLAAAAIRTALGRHPGEKPDA